MGTRDLPDMYRPKCEGSRPVWYWSLDIVMQCEETLVKPRLSIDFP